MNINIYDYLYVYIGPPGPPGVKTSLPSFLDPPRAPGGPRKPPGSPQGPYGPIRVHMDPYGHLPGQFSINILTFWDSFWRIFGKV